MSKQITVDEFLSTIDWIALGKQKADLVKIITQRADYAGDEADEDWVVQSLTGILHLIDGLQDFFDSYLPEEA